MLGVKVVEIDVLDAFVAVRRVGASAFVFIYAPGDGDIALTEYPCELCAKTFALIVYPSVHGPACIEVPSHVLDNVYHVLKS